MNARDKTYALQRRLNSRGIAANFDQAETLRRAELTLQRWAELECGDSNDSCSWAIERDETTGIAYMCISPCQGENRRHRIPDRERGALRRVAAVCKAIGCFWFHQTDPRGCALYVSAEPITDSDYSSRGVACCE